MKKWQLRRVAFRAGVVAGISWGLAGIMPLQASNAIATLLGTCPNALPQPFTTNTHSSTAIDGSNQTTTLTLYPDAACALTRDADLVLPHVNGPDFPLNAQAGYFNYCTQFPPAIHTLGFFCCVYATGPGTRSMRLTQVATPVGSYATNGSCIACTCTGPGTASAWTVATTATLLL